MSAYIKDLRVEPYGWNVVFFNDQDRACRYLKGRKIPAVTLDLWTDSTTSGCTSLWVEERHIFVGVFNDNSGTIAHECVHAAVYILDDAGIPIYGNNHEALTYLVGHLVREFYKAAARKNTKRKK